MAHPRVGEGQRLEVGVDEAGREVEEEEDEGDAVPGVVVRLLLQLSVVDALPPVLVLLRRRLHGFELLRLVKVVVVRVLSRQRRRRQGGEGGGARGRGNRGG